MTEFEKRCIEEMQRNNDLTKVSMTSMLKIMDSMMGFTKLFFEAEIDGIDDEDGKKIMSKFYTEFSNMTNDLITRIEKQ